MPDMIPIPPPANDSVKPNGTVTVGQNWAH